MTEYSYVDSNAVRVATPTRPATRKPPTAGVTNSSYATSLKNLKLEEALNNEVTNENVSREHERESQPIYRELEDQDESVYRELKKEDQLVYRELENQDEPAYEELENEDHLVYRELEHQDEPVYRELENEDQPVYKELENQDEPVYRKLENKDQQVYRALKNNQMYKEAENENAYANLGCDVEDRDYQDVRAGWAQ